MDPAIISAYASVVAAVGQIISAVAVVVSILFLARQLKQGTEALKVATYQADVANSISILSALYTNPEVANLQLRAHTEPHSLSPADALRWDNYMLAALRHLDSLYYQYRVGTLEHEIWLGYRAAFAARLQQPGWHNWFEQHRDAFSPALGELVKELVRPPAPAASGAHGGIDAKPADGAGIAPAPTG